ncbi:MAG: CPXCG motif-containing cysteine-rich protein [Archangium sp.]
MTAGEQTDYAHQCPYCGEPVMVSVAPEEAEGAQYVEDCPVCCRPWQVELSGGSVTIGRDDAQ